MPRAFSIEVPFAFEAGGKNFPAGAYTVDSVTSGVLVIRGASSRRNGGNYGFTGWVL